MTDSSEVTTTDQYVTAQADELVVVDSRNSGCICSAIWCRVSVSSFEVWKPYKNC